MSIDAATLNLLGLAATGFSVMMWLPQARITWQNKNDASRLAGISETTQWLTMVGAVAWAIFGVGSGSFWVAAPSLISFPLALATIVVVRRGRRLPPLVTSVSIIAIDEPLSVTDNTGAIAIISTEDSADVGDFAVTHDSLMTGTIPIISSEESADVGDLAATHDSAMTGTIPIISSEDAAGLGETAEYVHTHTHTVPLPLPLPVPVRISDHSAAPIAT